ncbi:MAG TPA: hypothetical protein VKZ63_02610, partial [Kofleriaceae bacterium]|nr:hypothetical protein [Kofleriaceae bacterium]
MRLGKYWQLGFGMALSVSVIAILSSVALAQDEEGGEEEMTFEAEGTPTAAPEPPPDNKPPTKTLERAIKLYDKKDYYSASIELGKVLNGETDDSEANKQRAEFFMGKTLYQMG